jgi:hypothetical protein
MISAGSVKITPAARPSPDAAAVCTALFWRMLPVRRMRKIAIEITAAGTLAETVMPANIPRYALAPARMIASSDPRISTPTVSSGRCLLAGMYGSTFWGAAAGGGASDMRETSSGTRPMVKRCGTPWRADPWLG